MTTTHPESTVHEPEPSDLYAGARTAADVGRIYKETFAREADAYGGDMWAVPFSIRMAIGEDARRAYAKLAGQLHTKAEPRPRVQSEARPVEHDDGSLTIVCAGPCGTEKPVNKFPTLKGGGGRRGTVCRECEIAGRTARKSGG